MKSNKYSINLTPLLDVILIIVFIFIVYTAFKNNMTVEDYNQKDMQNQKVLAKVQEDLEKAYEINEKQNSEIEAYLSQIESLNKNIEDLNSRNEQKIIESLIQTNDGLQQEINAQNEQIAVLEALNETKDTVVQAVSRLIGMSKEQIIKAVESSDSANATEVIDKIESMTSTSEIAKEATKMYTAFSRYNFIDVSIKGVKNQVYINNEDTGISMITTELKDIKIRESISATIVDKIGNVLENQKGGHDRTIITLYGEESQILRAAYLLVWDSIKKVQDTYGSDHISKMEFKY